MAIKDDVKLALRISNVAYDNEITDLIAAAMADLKRAGVVSAAIVDTDTLIKRAIITYCKANFGWSNPDSEKLQKAYDNIKYQLSLSVDHAFYAVTFTVKDSITAVAIREALVTFDGKTISTGADGKAVFYALPGSNYEYIVTADGYASDDDDDNLIDVTSAAVAVAINLIAG